MTALDDAAAFSAFVAPVIDRTAISVHHAVDKEAIKALRGENKFSPAVLIMMAGNIATGPIGAHEFSQLSRYQHFGPNDALLAGMAERGAIVIADDGSFAGTPAAIEMSQAIVRLQAAAVDALFGPLQASLATIRPLMDSARAAAIADPMSMLATYASRSWLPDDASDAAHIWNSSVLLRLHRSDAHAKAWSEAGHTTATIRQLAKGPERDAIEVRTNELAAAPWVPLNPHERLTLLAGLASLPVPCSPVWNFVGPRPDNTIN
jgi:hypothetical protein